MLWPAKTKFFCHLTCQLKVLPILTLQWKTLHYSILEKHTTYTKLTRLKSF